MPRIGRRAAPRPRFDQCRPSVENSLLSGAEGDRTPDLLDAIQALSQLSYGPRAAQCSAELVLVCPVDPLLLIVLGRTEPQRDSPALREVAERQEVATVEVYGIRREGVDLTPAVAALHESARAAPPTDERNNEHVAVSANPLALDANEPPAELEDEVVPETLVYRSGNGDAELDRGSDYRCFRDRPLLGRREHLPMLVARSDN